MGNTSNLTLKRYVAEHLEDIARIERSSFSSPWPRGGLQKCLGEKSVRCLVVCDREKVVGYIIFTSVDATSSVILNLAVRSSYRRLGIASRLLRRVKAGLEKRKKKCLRIIVDEYDLAVQLLARHVGFRHVKILRRHCSVTRHDAYLLEWKF